MGRGTARRPDPGSFLSSEAAAALAAQLSDEFAERAAEQMQTTYVHTREWALIELSGRLNLALFSSGLGDGAYASYWGLDGTDRPVVLLTDFGLLDLTSGAPSHEGGEALVAILVAAPRWMLRAGSG